MADNREERQKPGGAAGTQKQQAKSGTRGPRSELPDALGHRLWRVRLAHARRVRPELGIEVFRPHPHRLGHVAIGIDDSTMHEALCILGGERVERAQPQVKG